MSAWRALLRSSHGRAIVVVVGLYAGWQVWLTLRAPGKLAPELSAGDSERVSVVVRLPFPPERFHVVALQKFGRVSGTVDDEVELRGVPRAALTSVARPYWVRRVEPLPTGR